MQSRLTRREVVLGGLSAATILAGGELLRADGEALRRPNPGPDRSGQAPTSPVAITRCESYEPKLLRRRLDEMLNLVGGFKELVQGKTVTVKMNMTGGPKAGPLGGLMPYLTYHIHPNLVAALCAALNDAGAKRIVLVESSYEVRLPEEILSDGGWDVKGIKEAGGHKVTFLDTRYRGPFPKYSELKVAWGGYIYPAFHVNQAYEKTDVFISLAKMKDHANAGVTMGAKNLFGMPPISLYGGDAPNENSTSYRGPILHMGEKKVPSGVPGELEHGIKTGDWARRVPRITADVVGARPIDLVIIDGVVTNRGGEGPWIADVAPMMPKLLMAGRNVVCADAVCTAVMGYDPMADHFQFPFMGENHLKLLAEVGVGTNDPKRIEVQGLSIKEALHPFNPNRLKIGRADAWIRWNCARMRACSHTA